jgi:phosphoglycolate phosphatase
VADRLVLWDIDGTLISCGPAGRLALETGAGRAAGLTEVPQVVMSGKTDPQIVTEILTAAGIPKAEILGLLPRALSEAELALANSEETIKREGRVHPGIREMLAALTETGVVRQTLVTGNIAANAALKVGAFDLGEFIDFEVGAYGSDDSDRNRLVPVCLERISDLRGEVYAPERVWVIGDTSNDLECARAAGVRCLLVGTGKLGFDSVRDLGADAQVENLADTDSVLKVLFDG